MHSPLRLRSRVLTTHSGNPAAQSQPATQPQSSGGLFASAQQPQSGSLFGAQPPGTSLKLATPGASSGGLFGGSSQPKPSLL
jgi:hypothetical protein